ncbi:MAG: hypothetical protein GXY76_09020 [Chloroflexi bacterium]|nr:hypothetical protein [Chloroflexota bacterium]
MSIEVSAVGYLTRYVGQTHAVAADGWVGRPVSELLARYGIPESVSTIILVNGQRQAASYLVRDGDQVRLLPLATGG